MALAANVRQYLPPKRIQQMEADLADLARVWENTRFAGPWGWSLATKQRYKQMGVAEECLPSDEWLAEVRRLSSREFACGYIKELLEELKDERLLGSEMRWVTAPLPPRGEGYRGAYIFKSPWSSSGRGVFVSPSPTSPRGEGNRPDGNFSPLGEIERGLQRLQGFLSSQGGYVMDRFYEDKVLDFAMEFFVNEDGSVDFLGYSVFHADTNGTYGYNYVESQEELLQRISPLPTSPKGEERLLDRLIDYHKAHLSTVNYSGPVGIDMLKTADGHIHPCLEMNFRMNMGILALLLQEQYGAGCTIQLTPHRPNGFEALVERGKLMIAYRKQ